MLTAQGMGAGGARDRVGPVVHGPSPGWRVVALQGQGGCIFPDVTGHRSAVSV